MIESTQITFIYSLILISKETLISLIEDSKMFEKLKNTPSYDIEVDKAEKKLEYIVSKLSENLINVFKLDSEEGSQDIELAILRAFLNCI